MLVYQRVLLTEKSLSHCLVDFHSGCPYSISLSVVKKALGALRPSSSRVLGQTSLQGRDGTRMPGCTSVEQIWFIPPEGMWWMPSHHISKSHFMLQVMNLTTPAKQLSSCDSTVILAPFLLFPSDTWPCATVIHSDPQGMYRRLHCSAPLILRWAYRLASCPGILRREPKLSDLSGTSPYIGLISALYMVPLPPI